MSSTQHLKLLPLSLPGTPRGSPRLGYSRPSTPVSRPRTPLLGGKFDDGEDLPGWQTKGLVITQALPLARFSRWRFRIYLAFFFITLGLVIAHAVRLNPRIVQKIWPSTPTRYQLQVLIPAAKPSLGLCRTLLTGAVLNYPTPTLINWGRNFTDEQYYDGGEDFAKASAIRELVTRMRINQGKDILLIVDAEDAWFQLRPSVLIDRFKWLLEDSNRLVRNIIGSKAQSEEHLKQAVIFGARKTCKPNFAEDLGCYPQPESPLDKDMYGRFTDTEQGHTKVSSYRPRYLDKGIIMASAEDIRQIMIRAHSKQDETQRGPGGSAQSIFNTMFGQQEFQRQVMHERHLSLTERIKRWLGKKEPSILDPIGNREQMKHLEARTHDFGIGLDYYGMIAHQTSDSARDARFIRYQGEPSVATKKFDCKPHVQKQLPNEISSTWITSVRVRQEELTNKTWADLPLYTDICTGTIPVIINQQGDAVEREAMWKQFWMQPMAKQLFRQQHRRATYESPEDFGIDIGINSGGARLVTGEKVSWEEICEQFEPQLFAGNSDVWRPEADIQREPVKEQAVPEPATPKPEAPAPAVPGPAAPEKAVPP